MTAPKPLVAHTTCRCGLRLYLPNEKVVWCADTGCQHTTQRQPTYYQARALGLLKTEER